MKLIVVLFLCLSAVYADDISKTFQQIAQDYGYPFEQHFITTSDGYILRLFRIAHGKNQESSNNNSPILIQHGIFDSADFVVSHGEDKSPAFNLADQLKRKQIQ